MSKRIIGLFILVAFITLIAGCVEVSELEYLEFETYPKTTYLVGEELENFEITYKLKAEETAETLAFDDDLVVITGFSTDTAGTFTMTVSLEGYEDASINFVYTVVNSMIDTLFAGGYGTEDDPYQIETPQQLSNIRLALDQHFVLNNDIDLTGFDWTPIGEVEITVISTQSIEVDVTTAFSGVLDGNNHEILVYSRAEGQFRGLFEAIEGVDSDNQAVVKNLTLNLDIDVTSSAAGLGYIADAVYIDNVTTTGSMSSQGGSPMFGLVIYAWNGNSTIINSTNTTDMFIPAQQPGASSLLTENRPRNYLFAGGFTVQTFAQTPYTIVIENSTSSGDITFEYRSPGMYPDYADLGTIAGTFVGQKTNDGGYFPGGSTLTFLNSTSTGVITGNAIGTYDFTGKAYDTLTGQVIETVQSYQGHSNPNVFVGRHANNVGSIVVTND